MTEEVFVELPSEANLPRGTVWQKHFARCAAAACQANLESLPEDAGFRVGLGAPSYYREKDGVSVSVRIEDPLVIGPKGPAHAFFEWLRQRVALNGLDCFDRVRGPKYLGMENYGILGGLPRDDSSRVRRGDGLDDGSAASQYFHNARNPHRRGSHPRRRIGLGSLVT